MDQLNKTEKQNNYKTAFIILCIIVILLLTLFVIMLYIQKQTVKETELISGILATEEIAEKSAPTQETLLININTATEIELTLLPGIGNSRARDIVDYRNEYGRFTKPEDLLNVKGIGENTLEKILPYIVFEDP